MNRRTILLLALMSIMLILIPACSSDGDGVNPGFRDTGTIYGRVMNVAEDAPLPGVTVRITSVPYVTDLTETGTIEIVTTTNADGYYNRADIPNGQITVSVSKDGFRTPDSKIWALSPGGAGELRFEMAPGEDPVDEFTGDEQSARPPEWTEGK